MRHLEGLWKSLTYLDLMSLVGKRSLWGLAYKALIPFVRALSSWPNHFPKIPPPNTITLGFTFSTYKFQGDTHIQTIAMNSLLMPTKICARVPRWQAAFISSLLWWASCISLSFLLVQIKKLKKKSQKCNDLSKKTHGGEESCSKGGWRVTWEILTVWRRQRGRPDSELLRLPGQVKFLPFGS